MKKTILLGAVLASGLVLGACNSNKGGNTAAANKAATNTSAPAANTTAPATGNTAAPTGATADATNQNFTIRNNTGQAINELYVSAVTTNDWEEDVLGRDTLPNGETAEIAFERSETQCNWDLRVVFEGGQSLEERNVNLCQTAEIEIAP